MKELSKDNDIYWTIEKENESELVVVKSKFIAQAYPVNSKEKAEGILSVIKKKHYNANHNCFAYILGQTGLEFRYSDDGEPAGTAGKPILFMLNKYEVKDIILIVTRYFGGTQLGVGNLARAYSEASGNVLELCKKKPVYITQKLKVFCGYEDVSQIKRLLVDYAIAHSEEYLDSVEITAEIPITLVEEFCAKVVDLTSGRAGTLRL